MELPFSAADSNDAPVWGGDAPQTRSTKPLTILN